MTGLRWAGLALLLLPALFEGTNTHCNDETSGSSGSSGVSADGALHGSGSYGSSYICSNDTTSPPPSPSPSPSSSPSPATTYIEVILSVGVHKFNMHREAMEGEIMSALSSVLMESEVYSSLTLVLELDAERSHANGTILRLHLISPDSGAHDPNATEEAFYFLRMQVDILRSALRDTTGYELVEFGLILPEVATDPTTVSTQSPVSNEQGLTWFDYFLVVLGAAVSVFAVASIIMACCCRWRSHRREEEEKEKLLERQRAGSEDGNSEVMPHGYYQLEKRLDAARKVARVGFQSRIQIQSHPLTMEEMNNLLQNPATLRAEYSSIPSNLVTMAEVPPGAEGRNRYKDILPNPHTRVALFLKFGVANSDYINANYIRGYNNTSKAYIATQGPLPWTVDDFWRMVWEQKSSVVVMVTGLEEKHILKCAQYWPDSQRSLRATYGELNLTLRKRIAHSNFTITHFHLQHSEKLVSREITHYWFTAWPDHGVPTSTGPALDFLNTIRQATTDIPAPIIVHCSAGIGRTGVFIGANIGMTQMEREGEIDVLKIVSTLRQDRGGMVQTEQQYIFLYQLLLEYAKQLREQSQHGHAPLDPRVTPNDDSSEGNSLIFRNNHTMI